MGEQLQVSTFSFARIGALLGPVLGLALVLAACTAQPVRTLSEIPDRIGNRSPAAAPGMAAPQSAPAPMIVARPSNTSAAPRAARIDEVYPGRGDTLRPGGSTPRQTAPGDIDLTFEGADIREVLRVVLGDLLGANYVVDPNVTGTVSLTTNRPLRREDLLPVLEGVLASQGVRILNYGQTLRVTRNPDAEALAQGGISTGAGGSFRVFTLDHMSVADMRNILEPMLPQGSISGANEARGIIIASGSAAVLRLAAGTVDIFDVDQMAGQTSALVTLESGDARTVVAELASIFGAGGTRVGEQGPLQLLPIERMNGVLILSRQRALVEQAREWIYRLDRRSDPTEKRVYVYYVQHGGAQRLADALKEIVGNRAPAAGATPEPTPVSATAAGAQTAAQAAARLFGDDIRIAIDGERNALLIATSPANFRIVEEVLTRLDIQPLQVLIEASIFEVTLGDTLRFGLQYALNTGGIGGADRGIIGLGRGTATSNGPGSIIRQVISPITPGFNFTLEGAAATKLVIDALSDLTEVNMLSSPNVIVLNNNTAALNVGDEVPIITQSTTSAVTDNPLIVNTVQYRQTGVSLEVTPQANASGMVTLQLSQTVSDVRVTTSSTIDSPTIQNRSLLSTVTVRSGETIMLGGLIREQASTTKSGIPLLNDLPLLGPLFGFNQRTANRTELVALIRPVIIGSAEEAAAVTTTLRNKFLGLVRQEQEGIRQPRRVITADR